MEGFTSPFSDSEEAKPPKSQSAQLVDNEISLIPDRMYKSAFFDGLIPVGNPRRVRFATAPDRQDFEDVSHFSADEQAFRKNLLSLLEPGTSSWFPFSAASFQSEPARNTTPAHSRQ